MRKILCGLTVVVAISMVACDRDSASESPAVEYQTIEWTDLIPEEDLELLLNPPESIAEIEDGSAEDQVTGQLSSGSDVTSDAAYNEVLSSTRIIADFDQRKVRVPGFVVPLEFDEFQTITTFFLVPYFGACIHQPPPPPNQIIYAEFEPGFKVEALYDPFWIEGTLSTSLVQNDMATAAYSLEVNRVTPYYEDVETEPEA